MELLEHRVNNQAAGYYFVVLSLGVDLKASESRNCLSSHSFSVTILMTAISSMKNDTPTVLSTASEKTGGFSDALNWIFTYSITANTIAIKLVSIIMNHSSIFL